MAAGKRREALGRRGDHPVVRGEQIPAGLGLPRRFADRAVHGAAGSHAITVSHPIVVAALIEKAADDLKATER
jgi:hypothetical protein